MKRKRFAEFYHTGLNGAVIPMCGSDSIHYIDARLSTINCVNAARTAAQRLNSGLNKGIVAFRIASGTIQQPQYLTGIIKL